MLERIFIRWLFLIWLSAALLTAAALQIGLWQKNPLLSFIANPDGVRDIYLVDASTGVAHNLTRTEADEWSLTWTQQGDRLMYSGLDANAHFGESVHLLDWRRNQHQLIDTGSTLRVFGLGFSADGEQIVFFSSYPRNISDVYSLSPGSPEIINLTGTANVSEENPLWSPTGDHILFSMQGDLYVLETRSGIRLRLTQSTVWDEHPVWSPDGRRITFQRTAGIPLRRTQYVMNLEGDEIALTLEAEPRAGAASWSPDGSRLALASTQGEIFIYDLASSTSEMIADNGYSPVWSPDGAYVAYISQRVIVLLHPENNSRVVLNQHLTTFPPLIWVR